jgi:hypothetical protein
MTRTATSPEARSDRGLGRERRSDGSVGTVDLAAVRWGRFGLAEQLVEGCGRSAENPGGEMLVTRGERTHG